MKETRTTWRLLVTPPASGAWNMAVDEAILEVTAKRQAPPTLRLYAWEPPCLSLGFSQPIADVDLSRLADLGWDLVRRPTGGRAILHTDELTYAVISPANEPRLVGSVLESYQRLSLALYTALQLLNAPVSTQMTSPDSRQQSAKIPVCFEVSSSYEITAQGKKLIGSAQARKKEGVLQHGSLPLFGDLTRITQVLSFPLDPGDSVEQRKILASERLQAKATTLENCLGSHVSWDDAAQAFTLGFSQALNLDLRPGELTPGERERAKQLASQKYAADPWTMRV